MTMKTKNNDNKGNKVNDSENNHNKENDNENNDNWSGSRIKFTDLSRPIWSSFETGFKSKLCLGMGGLVGMDERGQGEGVSSNGPSNERAKKIKYKRIVATERFWF